MQNGARWVEANGTVSRIVLSGTGDELIVLVHEMGGTLDSWDAVATALETTRRVLRYDVRGAGLSQKVRGTLSIEVLAADLAAILDGLGVREAVAVVGTAVGGAIALQFAADFAARARALIVTSPATGVPEERRAALLERSDRLELRGIAPDLDERLLRSYPPVLRADPAVFAQVRASRLAADPFGVAAASRMLAGLDMTDALGRVRCPTLVLAAEHDGERPPARVAPIAAQIKDAEYKIVPSGHFMALQTPALLLAEIERFLAAQGRSTGR